MLEPESRTLLLDSLRPPVGYRLDRAIGATFSLDLQALLTVPLAFAMFDTEAGEDGTPDIIALLEATRRHAGRISLFCQAGRISLPRSYSKIFANIEDSIHEVTAPLPGGIFHPKVWAMRFRSDDGPDQYRVLVLSRNLTFDRSWDVVVRLDGERAPQGSRAEAAETNRPLTDFLGRLPSLSVHPLPAKEADAITTFVRDLRQVAFKPPSGFNRVSFWSSGLTSRTRSPFGDGHSRAMVISPFLTAGPLDQITSSGKRHALISRREALDQLPEEALGGFDEVYVLDTSVEVPEEGAEAELTGLHAKVFVLEHGGRVTVYAGSANATDAGFGRNVEFLAGLHGYRHQIGVDTVLRPRAEDGLSLADLLTPYMRPGKTPAEETARERLEHQLDDLRHTIAAVPITITVQERSDGDYDLRFTSEGVLLPTGFDATLKCRPLGLGSGFSREVAAGEPLDVSFDRVSFAALTTFVAFELTLRSEGHSMKVEFVVDGALVGAPEDRQQRILSSLLDDREKVLRYLLFLLADPDASDAAILAAIREATSRGEADERREVGVPLLEVMLHNLARDPSRLDPVARLIEDLSSTDDGRRRLPAGLIDVWPAIWQARQEVEK